MTSSRRGDRADQLRSDLEKRQVHVRGLRVFEAKSIDQEPDELSDDLVIWKFFSKLADGDSSDRIASISIRPDSEGVTQCNCIADAHGRLKGPCRCGNGTGTITFRTVDGVSQLTTNLRNHYLTHADGYTFATDRDPGGNINFCADCCLFNRQVLLSRAGRRSAGNDGLQLPGELTEQIIEPERIKAVTVILSTMLQGQYPQKVRNLGTDMIGKHAEAASEALCVTASDLLRQKSKTADPTGEYIMYDLFAQAMTTPVGEVEEWAYKVADAMVTPCTGSPGSFVHECLRHHGAGRRHVIMEDLRKAIEEGAVLPPAPPLVRPIVVPPLNPRDTGMPTRAETLEAEINRFGSRLERILAEYPLGSLKDKSASTGVLKSIEKRVTQAFDILAQIFGGVEITAELEAEKTPSFNSLTRQKDLLLTEIATEISRLTEIESEIRSRTSTALPLYSRAVERDEVVPSGETIDHEIQIMEDHISLIKETVAQCQDVLKDPNIGRMRPEFLNILKDVIPAGKTNLADLIALTKSVATWLRQVNREMTTDRKNSLSDCVRRAQCLQTEWQEVTFNAHRIDREHGLSQKPGAEGIAVKRAPVETFYGQEDGKPFQNILEWISELEDRVLRHYPGQEDKIQHALGHLSHKIATIAKTQKCASYKELKEWLLDYFMSDNKILDSWISQLEKLGHKSSKLKSADVGLYVTSVRGILKQVSACAELSLDLKNKLFCNTKVCYLAKLVLTPLGKPTGKDQWSKFSDGPYKRLLDAAKANGVQMDPHELFAAMETRLEQIRIDQKAKANLDDEAERGGAGRNLSGTTEFQRRVKMNMEYLAQEGKDEDDQYEEACRMALRQISHRSPSDSGGTQPPAHSAGGGGHRLNSVNIAVTTGPFNQGWGLPYLVYSVAKTGAKDLTVGPGQVLITADSLAAAKTWHSHFTLRCWVCPNSAPAHEFAGCRSAMSASNKTRMEAVKNPKQGPGLQCFSCLDGVCFATRCLEQGNNSRRGTFPLCSRSTTLTQCQSCSKEISSNPKKRGKLKPYNALICCLDGHATGVDLSSVINDMMDAYGRGMSELKIFTIIDPHSLDHGSDGANFDTSMAESDNLTDSAGNDSQSFLGDTSDDDIGDDLGCPGLFRAQKPERYVVTPSEYPDTHEPMMMDTTNGRTIKYDDSSMGDKVVTESSGIAVYFMQQLRMSGKTIVCFYDTGAQMSLIKTDLARYLELPMINREGFHLVGAGEHVTRTTDGTYEMMLGKGPSGEIFRFKVCGMRRLTGTMLQCVWESIHDEVRAKSSALKREHPCFLNLGLCLKDDEPLPRMTGGSEVELLIGLKLPTLQPTVIFSLPSGILVARAKLYDIYDSNVVFGGMSQTLDAHLRQTYVQLSSARRCSYYEAYNSHCLEEYIKFRDSIYPDPILVDRDDEGRVRSVQVKQWVEACEEEDRDVDLDDNPFIIAGSEKKRSLQLQQERFYRRQQLEDEEDLSIKTGGQPGIRIHELPNMGGPDDTEQQTDADSRDSAVIHFCNEELSPYVYGKPKTVLEENGNMRYIYYSSYGQPEPHTASGKSMLYKTTIRRGGVAEQIDQAVAECFGTPYSTGLLTSLNGPDVHSEEVLFESEGDRIATIQSIVPETELHDVIWRQTGLHVSRRAPDISSVGARGMAAFTAAMPPDWGYKPPEHHCDVCTCHVQGKWDDHILEDEVPLFNSRGINKLRSMIRKWEDDENIGTTVSFRCPRCQECPDCLKSGRTRARSIREDDEQAIIEASVQINYETAKTTVLLPFIRPPAELVVKFGAESNFKQAKAFITRMSKASPEIRTALAAFWLELESRNVVVKLSNLPNDLQEAIASAPVKHFYPWNFVQKPGSTSTPVRIVMDSRSSGFNDWLAKGINSLNNLQVLVLLWRTFLACGTFDISKMYNMLHIDPAHLCYQLVLWRDQMDPAAPIEIWVITRAIYGTISSGNQAEVAIRRGATHFQNELPEGAYTIIHETYVDDGMPGRDDPEQLNVALEQVETILKRIGFNLKCTVVSGQKVLSPKASSDGINVSIAGYNWQPQVDKLSLAVKECNFNPLIRGAKKPNQHTVHSGEDIDGRIFPTSLTRAQVVGKVAELFDPNGLWMPVTMLGKILCRRYTHLGWKDPIPDEDLEVWLDFVKIVQDVRSISIDRCAISADSVGQAELLAVNDGSQHGCAATVYLRTQLKNGSFSSKLLFSRSALCPPDQSIPRNELAGAHLGAACIYTVRSAMKDRIGSTSAFTDSNVVMCWLGNPQLKLKNWVMARVKEIKRVTKDVVFYWVKGEVNIADLATKGIVSFDDVDSKSAWQLGPDWMNGDLELARNREIIRTYDDVMLKLDAKEQRDLAAEQHPSLPDLVNGGRKGGNSELDADALISTVSLRETCLSQIVDFRRPDMAAPESFLVGGFGQTYCLEPHCLEQTTTTHQKFIKNLNHSGVSRAFSKTSSYLNPCTPRSRLPLDQQIIDFPEEHSLLALGWAPDDVRSVLINHPANYRVMPGGINVTQIKLSSYIVDPIHYGFRKAYRATTVFFHFKNKLVHRTHQLPTEGHHLYGKLTEDQVALRAGLKAKCVICKTLTVNFKGANLAYLDHLTTGHATVSRLDELRRTEGESVWKPRFALHQADLCPDTPHVLANRARLFLFNDRVDIRTRTMEKQGIDKRVGTKPQRKKTVKAKPKGKPKHDSSAVVFDALVEIDDTTRVQTWQYFMRKCSQEVSETLDQKDKNMFTLCQDGIWRYFGRLKTRDQIEHRDVELSHFFDSDEISYVQPVGLANSPFVYTLVMDIHWKVHPHRGVFSTNRVLSSIMHVVKGGNLTRAIREDCLRCRRILKKTMAEMMGDIPLEKLIISPAFYAVQIDDCGPFKAYSPHGQRSVLKINALVITCINTSAVTIWALETQKAPSVLKALLRHSYRYGYPAVAYIDLGPGLVKGANHKVELSNHSTLLRQSCGMRVIPKPPQAHAQRGKVERVVKTLKEWIQNEELSLMTQSILDWETTFAFISNFLNNLPMARLSKNRSLTTDLNDIATPNRLLLGRNNQRSPTFVAEFESGGQQYSDRLLKNSEINYAWYELLLKMVPSLVFRPKWFKDQIHKPKVGDYVLFRHNESTMGPEHSVWRIGLVIRTKLSECSTTWEYLLSYQCAIRRKDMKAEDWPIERHETLRSGREVVLLLTEEEIASPPGSDAHRNRDHPTSKEPTLAGHKEV